MTQPEIAQLIAAMRINGVTRLEWEHLRKGTLLCLTLPETMGQPPAMPTPEPVRLGVIAPTIGTFVARGGDDGLPSLAEGASVQAGEILGYIAQGPVLHLLTAPCDGTLSGGLADPGQVFGYGDTVLHLTGEAV